MPTKGTTTAEAVNQKIAAQQRRGAGGAILHAPQCQRNQRNDDQRIEDDGGQNGALRDFETP